MTSLAHAQRQTLCDLFDKVGPDAPTLCEGWTARDLAAHLATRDRRPDAVPGIGVKALAGWTERVQRGYAERPYPEVVDLVRFGPPAYAVTRLEAVAERVNLAEYFIHTEDVLRAQTPTQHALVPDELAERLWALLPALGRMTLLRAKVAVRAAWPGHGEVTLRKGRDEGVTLTGRPGDLVLLLSGRRQAADVTVEGAPDAVAAFEATPLGL